MSHSILWQGHQTGSSNIGTELGDLPEDEFWHPLVIAIQKNTVDTSKNKLITQGL